ncbi:uncharacterized protein ACRADG_007584 [Cochliomyia hominivorax]
MKLVFGLILILATFYVNHITATSEPVCGYKNSQGETVFLKYLPYAKKGQDYVDFADDGKCVKRAICTETFKTQVEECKNFPVTCQNKQTFNGVFPACCVKC